MTTKNLYKIADSIIRRGWSEYREFGNELFLDDAYREARQDIMTADVSEETADALLDWFMI